MPTDVEICNLALSAIGTKSSIASLAEVSAEAEACAIWYPIVRDRVLRKRLWGCARGTIVLTLNKELPTSPSDYLWDDSLPSPPYRFEYEYPTDCVRARYIIPYGDQVPPASYDQFYTYGTNRPAYGVNERYPIKYEIASSEEGERVILTSQEDAVLIYTKQLTDPDTWDVGLQQAIISELAQRLAIPLTGREELEKSRFQLAAFDLETAAVDDANEGLDVVDPPLPDWLTARA